MAHSWNRLHTHHSPETVFDFISDFRHAALWDPSTRSVTKLSEGPIAQGSRFLLRAAFLGASLDFPYEIAVYERATRVVFAGSTPWFRYREQVTFVHGSSGTQIDYSAHMHLRSLLTVGNPLLSLVYQRIGDSATSGIVAALDKALASSPRI
jgi:Polyketide cyclase / dehydrase and lipid transport